MSLGWATQETWPSAKNCSSNMFLEAFKFIGLILIAATKFLYAPTSVYLAGYGFFETLLITSLGGIAGVYVFYRLGSVISRWWANRFPSKFDKKKFTKKNRVIINFRSKYGLYGLAFVTPCIISIPIGCFLVAKYYANDKSAMPILMASVLFWSLTLTSLTFLLGPIFG